MSRCHHEVSKEATSGNLERQGPGHQGAGHCRVNRSFLRDESHTCMLYAHRPHACIGTETGGWAVDMQWVQVRKGDEKGRCQISGSCPCPTSGLSQAGVGVRGPATEGLLSSAH